jgi:zinc protease
MTPWRLFATFLALALGLTPMAEAAPGKTFGAETFFLGNGMQVVVIANHRAPVVHHAVWYKIGAADEPPRASGIAHMLEHMMFKGTPSVPNGDFSRVIARNGGNDNAFTNHDYTGYFQNIAIDRLTMVMEMEADRMVNLAFEVADFETERDVVLEERRSRTDNRASAQFGEQMSAAQFLSHPYGTPIIGWEHEIRAFSHEDALAFYRRHYAPGNAILIVAGDVTADALRPLAERTYGSIPAQAVAERVRPSEPPQRAARRLVMEDERVAAPEWMRSYLSPSYHDDPDDIAVPLDVLAEVLGGSTTSRLYQSLVVEQQLATNAGAYYQGTTLDRSRFGVYARPAPGVTVEAVEAALDAELARLLADGVGEEELARAKFGIRSLAVYARDSLSSLARIFGVALTVGLTVEQVEAWPDEVQAVTAEDVLAAARAVLHSESSVTGVLLPADDGQGS